MTADAHPEYAKRLDVSHWRDGHAYYCYDDSGRDGCDCARLLLTEVRRLSAINATLVRNYNAMSASQARWAAAAMDPR